LFQKCERILDILTEKRKGSEIFGQKMEDAQREAGNNQNFRLRENESQLLIAIQKVLLQTVL
jgi:hypothetical protein